MAEKSLSALRKLQKKQFNRITKEELIDAILSADNTDTDDKLDLVVKELAELKSIITRSENESKNKLRN